METGNKTDEYGKDHQGLTWAFMSPPDRVSPRAGMESKSTGTHYTGAPAIKHSVDTIAIAWDSIHLLEESMSLEQNCCSIFAIHTVGPTTAAVLYIYSICTVRLALCF